MDAHPLNLPFRIPVRRVFADPIPANTVVIDAPGVLFDNSIWQRWLFQLLQRVGLQSEFDVFFQLWDEEYQQDVANGETDYWLALRKLLQASGMTSGRIDEVVAAGQARRLKMERPTCPLNGVGRCLGELYGRGFQLAALDEDPARRTLFPVLLRRWGLNSYFKYVQSENLPPSSSWDPILNSSEPRLTVFLSRSRRRLREASKRGCRIIHVGDSGDSTANWVADLAELQACLRFASSRQAA